MLDYINYVTSTSYEEREQAKHFKWKCMSLPGFEPATFCIENYRLRSLTHADRDNVLC